MVAKVTLYITDVPLLNEDKNEDCTFGKNDPIVIGTNIIA